MEFDALADALADDIAAAFHSAYERLAPEHGYERQAARAGPMSRRTTVR